MRKKSKINQYFQEEYIQNNPAKINQGFCGACGQDIPAKALSENQKAFFCDDFKKHNLECNCRYFWRVKGIAECHKCLRRFKKNGKEVLKR